MEFDRKLSARSRGLFNPHSYTVESIRQLVKRQEGGQDAIFLARDGSGAVAAYLFLWYVDRPVALLGIGLADAYQGRGLGRQLLELLVAEGRRRGLDGLELTTAMDNDRAFALYQKLGFKHLGDVENVVGGGGVVVERAMFLPLKEGAKPMVGKHAPPVL